MRIHTEYDFASYLAAKKSIDDRALNRHVWRKLAETLARFDPHRSIGVLELGAGIGIMVERLVDWGLLVRADYTAIDADEDLTNEACNRIARWGTGKGFELQWDAKNKVLIHTQKGHVNLRFLQMDVYDFFRTNNITDKWDVGVAHAFLDLIDISEIIPQFCSSLKGGGYLYLSLNYDGETILLPHINRHLDTHIIELYNQSMDRRKRDGRHSGDSQTGRHLFHHLEKANMRLLAVGSSDWVVFPKELGYSKDEVCFLHYMVDTIYQELKDHPSLDTKTFESWVQQRHHQIEERELIFIAKQFDFLAQVPES